MAVLSFRELAFGNDLPSLLCQHAYPTVPMGKTLANLHLVLIPYGYPIYKVEFFNLTMKGKNDNTKIQKCIGFKAPPNISKVLLSISSPLYELLQIRARIYWPLNHSTY